VFIAEPQIGLLPYAAREKGNGNGKERDGMGNAVGVSICMRQQRRGREQEGSMNTVY